jgi:hypothetical protein
MSKKARITLGIALLVASLAMIGREIPWFAVIVGLFAVFLVIWGREERATEIFIERLPGGPRILVWLREFDLILTPRDLKYEAYVERIVRGYNPLLQKSLRTLKDTRDPNSILSQDWQRFNADKLVDHPSSGPEGIKPELRDLVGRVLDDLGVF